MARERKYTKEEAFRRGREWYQQILPIVEAGNNGKYVAIDLDTGEFEVGDNSERTCARLHERLPEASVWLERIGYAAPAKLGWRFQGVKL